MTIRPLVYVRTFMGKRRHAGLRDGFAGHLYRTLCNDAAAMVATPEKSGDLAECPRCMALVKAGERVRYVDA